jgi:membrane-associated phospholipid phosphatase
LPQGENEDCRRRDVEAHISMRCALFWFWGVSGIASNAFGQARPAEVRSQPPFRVDPIADTGIISVSLGFGVVLEMLSGTGEIRPQQIAKPFRREQLLAIDRGVLSAERDENAGPRSNIGLGAAVAFAFVDPVLSGFRERSFRTGVVDGVLYAESLSLTLAFTDLVKLAVRRPRPRAYREAELHEGEVDYSNPSTDSALSFFSGHSSMTAAVSATATYLAFVRAPAGSARPWITLGAGTALTTFVSIERVRGAKHFPTDVLAGALAGAGVGIVVPQLHRNEDARQKQVWVAFEPAPTGGGLLRLSGSF